MSPAHAQTSQEEKAALEAYAKEGWDWLAEALDAMDVESVFDIAAYKARRLAEERAG